VFAWQVLMTNFSAVNPSQVNGEPVDGTVTLRHRDVFTVGDRAFRFEYGQ
jgi:hypothetical protein